MTRFLIFYFVAYGGAHYYLLRKLVRGASLSRCGTIIHAALLLLLFAAPLAARALETTGLTFLPELLANVGYLWMGLIFLFITAAVTLDTINLFIRFIVPRTAARPLSPRHLLGCACAYTVLVGIYGYFEAADIRTEHVAITSNRLPPTIGRLRIVQISDLHAGQIVREERIRNVLGLVTAAAPDLVVSTGDLVDGYQRHLSGLEQLFLQVTPRLGKIAILGNHEYYVGVDRSISFLTRSGFTVLRNETCELGNAISVIGSDDSRDKRQRAVNDRAEKDLLVRAAPGGFRLLLKHRPVVATDSADAFDLQLSGHVHKGQIFPFNLLTWLSFPVRTGLTELTRGHFLYVSRGTGVWGPPIRFLAPPEITVIDLLPDSNSGKNI